MGIDKYSRIGTPHKLEKDFGHLDQLHTADDPVWLRKHVDELMTESSIGLGQLSGQINQVLKTNYDDFKPEIAAARRAEKILAGRRAGMTFLKKHVEKARENITATKNKILRVTEPTKPKDQIEATQQGFRVQEIRALLRSIDPKYRFDKVRGNLELIQACIDAPVDSIISDEHLEQARKEYAFNNDPSLQEEEADAEQIYNFVKRRAGEINATMVRMLMVSKLPDPLPVQEFYDIFPPKTDREKVLAEKRILNESRVDELVAKKVKQLKVDEAKEREIDERKGNRPIPHR